MRRTKAPLLASLLLALVALVPGGYAFNYFCGCLYQDPVDIAVDTADRLNQPPIIVYTKGLPFTNVTDIVTTGTLSDGEPVTVYEYWFFWPGCQLVPAASNPLCAAGHINNDWEPAYVYWKTTNPLAPTLLAVWTRTHFLWRQVGGSNVDVNGTQPVIKLLLATTTILGNTYTGIIPQVAPVGFVTNFFGGNSSVTYPVNNNPSSLITQNNWTYPVVNGGPHTIAVTVDPNSPPSSGPTAYEPGAGPQDPFSLYGSGRNLQTGLAVGAGVFFIFFLLFSLAAVELNALRRRLRRKH